MLMRHFNLLTCFLVCQVQAASLPEHNPISLLIVADEVNPHRLADADLTQPPDLAAALAAPDSGLALKSIPMVDSQCIDDALVVLGGEDRPDVVLYFAHRGASTCAGENAQPQFTRLIEQGLEQGMGLVVLHHGLYVDFMNRGVKADLLHLIGSEADSIEWNSESGQRVFNVGEGHFIATNGITYETEAEFYGFEEVSAATYPTFSNSPDELYEVIREHRVAGEQRTPLFVTDSGTPRMLGYVLKRSDWNGVVVTYQPGEYQPNALDDRAGPNFHILVNAIYFAAGLAR